MSVVTSRNKGHLTKKSHERCKALTLIIMATMASITSGFVTTTRRIVNSGRLPIPLSSLSPPSSPVRKCHGAPCHTSLYASGSTTVNGDDNKINDPAAGSSSLYYSLSNDTKPKTSSLLSSLQFFFRYLLRSLSQRKTDNRLQHSHAVPPDSKRETLSTLKRSLQKLISLVGYDATLLIPAFGSLFLGAFFESVIPHYYSAALSCIVSAAPSAAAAALPKALAGLAATSCAAAFFTGLRGSSFWIAGSRGNYNVRVKLHRTILRQETGFFDQEESGVLLSRLNNDANKIGNVISFHVNIVLRKLLQLLFGVVFLLRISPRLSLMALAGIAAVGYLSVIYGRFSRGLAEVVQDKLAEGSAVAETSFVMSETVRAFDGVKEETGEFCFV